VEDILELELILVVQEVREYCIFILIIVYNKISILYME